MTVTGQTAEWQCTRCGSTNRKLVPTTSDETTDRCVYCRTRHHLEPGETAVRWQARAG